MKPVASIITFCALLGAANVASADTFLTPFISATTSFFQFAWSTTASFSQTGADGSVVSNSGTASGTGDLALTKTPTGYLFAFGGPGGQGWGTTDPKGLIVNEGPYVIGSIDYPWPSGVTDTRPGTFMSQGQLTLTPSGLTLTYSDGSHSNTFGPNLYAVFQGTGIAESAPQTTAPEPVSAMFVAAGLGVAALVRRRAG